MAITIKHAKTDNIADWTQTDLDAQIAAGNFPPGTLLADIVLPSDWNNDHTISGTIAIANGGTGQTTANAAINALLPSQTSQSGKVLSTNGTDTSWIAVGGSGTVTSVTGTAPISVATGTTTPVISMAAATTSVNGYLTSTDWNTFNGKQNAFGSQTANYVYAAPDGTAGTPTFRALVSNDIPSLSGTYVPYTGATAAVDLNAKSLTNISSLGINTTTVPTIKFRAFGDNGSTSRIAMRGYSADANSSAIRVTKFRGTYAAPQAPQSGDSLGKFELAGYGTTSSDGYAQASFEGVATEAWGATARGTKTLIKVTPNTTTTQATAVTIDQDKSATFAGALLVTGTTTLATSLSGLAKLTSGVVSTATSGTDYAPATSGSAILYGNGSGGFSSVTIGTGVSFAGGTLSATGSGGTVTSVTGTAPVVSSGGATPAISMAAANGTTNGYLTSTDWTTFNGKAPGTTFTTGYVPFGQGTTTLNQSANLFWDNTNNRLGIGTSSPTTKLTISANTALPSAGTPNSGSTIWSVGTDAVANGINFDSFASQNNFIARRANGTSASPSALLSGNNIFVVAARGYGATGYSTAGRATVSFVAAENWTDTAQGTYIIFNTASNGTAASAERIRIHDSGGVSIGNTTDPGATNLSVTGSITGGALSATSNAVTSVLAATSGLTANTTVTNTATFTTAGLTLATQTAAAGSVWRVTAYGQFTAASSATVRTAQIACFWGTTQLTAITPTVLASTAQTTQWQVEFELSATSTTAIWTTGSLMSRIASATALAIDNATAASTTVTAGTQTLDLQVRVSSAIAAESWIIQQVTMERIK